VYGCVTVNTYQLVYVLLAEICDRNGVSVLGDICRDYTVVYCRESVGLIKVI